MAARSRDSHIATRCSESQMTYTRFMQLFPDNDACLEHLKDKFFPDGSTCPACGKATKFHRVKSRSAYSCQYCRKQVYPTANTIFHKTTVSLQLWFWAVYLVSSTRTGVSAKDVEREVGVSYPTAHRMLKKIRTLMSDADDEPLSGEVEMDETYVGGRRRRPKGQHAHGRPAAGDPVKTPVFGMVERGGRVRATVVPDAKAATLMPHVRKYVLPSTTVFTDEWRSYDAVGQENDWTHRRVTHSQKVYVDGDAHTQTIEGFWSLVKANLRGTHHAVSRDYLQSYLDEIVFRYNRRDGREPMFWAIMDRITNRPGLAAG